MSRKSFNKLSEEIYAEYRQKGYSPADALYIAHATAGEIATAHHRAKASPHGRRRTRRTTRIRH